MKTVILSISVPIAIAEALHDRKEQSSLNVSAFCSRAIERELRRTIVESEPDAAPPTPLEYRATAARPVRPLIVPHNPPRFPVEKEGE